MFDEHILIFLTSDSFYLPSVKTLKMAANPLKKTEIRRYTTEVPALRLDAVIYGHGGHLCHVTKIFHINFALLIIRSLHMKFEFKWANGL